MFLNGRFGEEWIMNAVESGGGGSPHVFKWKWKQVVRLKPIQMKARTGRMKGGGKRRECDRSTQTFLNGKIREAKIF